MVRSFNNAPETIGRWRLADVPPTSSVIGFMEKNLSSEKSRLRASAAGRCNEPKRACTTTPAKKTMRRPETDNDRDELGCEAEASPQ